MNILVTACAVFSVLAILFLVSSFRQIRRGRLVRAGGSFTGCVATGSVGGAGILLAISYLGYDRLTDEQLVGLIEFSEIAPSEYTARLMIDGEMDRLLTLRGDEWQLDARVITWHAPATVLGLDPIYQLERLSGRYSDVDREVSEPRTVHALTDPELLDLWMVAREFPVLMPGVDAYYGTATYVPMADRARYEVSLSRDALLARPVNDAAREAIGNWASPER